jgi:hypothetical protein
MYVRRVDESSKQVESRSTVAPVRGTADADNVSITDLIDMTNQGESDTIVRLDTDSHW